MKLLKLADDLYVPEDFEKHHHYFADEKGEKEYTGVTSVLGVIAKNALIQWAANEACKHIWDNAAQAKITPNNRDDFAKAFLLEKYAAENYRFVTKELIEEARYAHRKKKEDAASKGTDLHALVEEYVRECIEHTDGLPTVLPANPQIVPFVQWAQKEGIRFLEAEKRLYSKEHWVAGTCDLVFDKDGKLFVGDVKTYKKLWDRVPMLQCAAYGLMIEAMYENREYIHGTDAKKIDGYCVIRIKDDFEVKWSYDVEGDRAAFLAALTLYRTLQNWAA